MGHPWGNAPGTVANRVALEACVQARNEGRDLAREGNEVIREASKWSPELAAVCEIWKEMLIGTFSDARKFLLLVLSKVIVLGYTISIEEFIQSIS